MTKLYLGLEPKYFHYPVIKTVPLPIPSDAFEFYQACTHIIFTSKETVRYFPFSFNKPCIAIGPATKCALQGKGAEIILAPYPTLEGVLELLNTIDGTFFYPHSKRARTLLKTDYDFALYDTVFQALEPIPNLADFDEIVFTSPSTVEGFLRIYKKLPEGKKLTAIGPITEQALKRCSSRGIVA